MVFIISAVSNAYYSNTSNEFCKNMNTLSCLAYFLDSCTCFQGGWPKKPIIIEEMKSVILKIPPISKS